MILEGTIRNGRVELDEPLDWREGTRVTVEVSTVDDEVLEYPHPMAPYDREKELALLRAAYADVKAGVPGMPLEEAMNRIALECGLPLPTSPTE